MSSEAQVAGMQRGDSQQSTKRTLSSMSASPRLEALSLGMVGSDNRQAIIIDIGTALTKIGYAGEFLPRWIIRTEILDANAEPVKICDTKLDESEVLYRLVNFFRHILFKCALTVAKDRRFVIVESVLSPTLWRRTIAKVLFEVMDAPSVLFAPSHLLATFPFGANDALIIDMGWNEASVIPVLEGVTLLYQLGTSNISAKRLEERAEELLKKFGKVLTPDGLERPLNEEDYKILAKERIVEDVVVRFCFVTKMERGRQIQAAGYGLNGDFPKPPPDVRIPFGDNMLNVPGVVREWTAEVIFEEDNDVKSLPQLVLDATLRCPIDSRRRLLRSLIVTGGSACMNGFYTRLRDEIIRSMNSSQYAENLGTIRSVKFYRLPNTSIEIYNSWMGGSMFGALEILPYRSLLREDWLKNPIVPDWTTNVHEIDADRTRKG